jgi:GT2 family glycosyltransferase
VIPSYRASEWLTACLKSVCRHRPTDCEVLLVDDASADGAVSQAATVFPGVKCVRLPRRGGFCVAANTGVRTAQGEYVELLNDDTEVTTGWAERALEAFANPRMGAVAPLVLTWPTGSHIDSAGDRYYLGGVAGKRGHAGPLRTEYLKPCAVFGASASSAFYRREALLRVGLFPESFGAYFEDVDLAFRLHRAGYEVRYEPRSRVLHRGGASHGTTHRRLLEQQSRNEERVFWRNVPSSALSRALPRHLAVLAAKAWRRATQGGLVPFVCGRLKVLGEAAELRRHRRWLRTLGPERAPEMWLVEERFWGSA